MKQPSCYTRAILLIGLFALALSAMFVFTWKLPIVKVGDGSEYYAMQIAWKSTNLPHMTEASWDAYDKLYRSNTILGFTPTEILRNQFPYLDLNGTYDFLHFWAYPGLAAAINKAIPFASTHASFLLLHSLLFALLATLAYRWHGKAGLLAVCILTFASPVIWFSNKVHSEWWTFCLTMMSVIAVTSKRWGLAAFLLALCSTQNISFAMPAGFCALVTLFQAYKISRMSVQDSLFIALALFLVTLHPLYYFYRFHVLTPTLFSGASLEKGSVLKAFNYILDPDIGLFPNWPLGIVIFIFAVFYLYRSAKALPKKYPFELGFYAVYLVSCFYAQAAATNVNSGATIDLARYGIWYIALAYPIVLLAENKIKSIKMASILFSIAITTFALFNILRYWPSNAENNTTPSPVSRWLYSHAPNIFNPNLEVFYERNSGIGETAPIEKPAIILGPDCKKVLLLGPRDATPHVYGHTLCAMSPALLVQHFSDASQYKIQGNYLSLSDEQIDSLRAPIQNNTIYGNPIDGLQSFTQFLGDGWSSPEKFGVWSDGRNVTLHFKFSELRDTQLDLDLVGFFSKNKNVQTLKPSVNGIPMNSFTISANQKPPITWRIHLTQSYLAAHRGIVDIGFNIEHPLSPAEVGLSNDTRKLGIGLIAIRAH